MHNDIERKLFADLSSTNSRVRVSAVKSPDATDTILRIAALHMDENVRLAASTNPNALEDTLLLMLNDELWGVGVNAAEHPNATYRVLRKAIKDRSDGDIPHAAIRNKRADKEFIHQLFKDKNPTMRCYAVLSPLASEELLIKAICDSDAEVRRHAIDSPAATEKVLQYAMKDENLILHVVKNENATDSIFKEALKSRKKGILSAAIRNKKATESVLLKGIVCNDEFERYLCADHPKATKKVLEIASKDKRVDIRCAAASNSRTPYEIWERLSRDRSKSVRKFTLRHPRAKKWSDPIFSLLQKARKKATMDKLRSRKAT